MSRRNGRQIAGSAADASQSARSAVDIADGPAGAGERLGEASADMSKFVKVIESIADAIEVLTEATSAIALNVTNAAARERDRSLPPCGRRLSAPTPF